MRTGTIGRSDSRQLQGRNSDAVRCQQNTETSGRTGAFGSASSSALSNAKLSRLSVSTMRDAAVTSSSRV